MLHLGSGLMELSFTVCVLRHKFPAVVVLGSHENQDGDTQAIGSKEQAVNLRIVYYNLGTCSSELMVLNHD